MRAKFPDRPQAVCICGGYGFPLGSASAARIVMIGKTLQSAGIGYRVLHCGPSPVDVNTRRSGTYQGIEYEYTTSVRRPENRALRLLVYLRAMAGLAARLAALWPRRRSTLVHLYVMMGPLNLYAGWLCRILGLAVCQELCEWWPGVEVCTPFTRWLHKKSMFRRATGVLAISKEIERRAREKAETVNPGLLVHRLPAIVDFERFAAKPAGRRANAFAYCGTWMNDIEFIIRGLGLAAREGYRRKLVMIGGCAEQGEQILGFARKHGVPEKDIVLTGCLDEDGLAECYRSADALLLPMRDDDQSRTRMPNKLPEYLASGRPVIGGEIGDLTDYLTDEVNAFLAKPGSEADFAAKLIRVMEDPARADAVGLAGQQTCQRYFDFRAHAVELARFVRRCIEHHNSTRENRPMMRAYLLFRNWICGLVALYLIAAGYVRRAHKRAMSGDAITSIYFHNPNRRLFERCVRWLERNGYRFVSAQDVIDVLYRAKKPPRGAVWLSIDDGFKGIAENVIPVAREHRVPITLFVPTGIVEGAGLFPWLRGNSIRDALTLLELKQIAAYPEVSFGSHTVTHAVTKYLGETELKYELVESKRALESWMNSEVQCFAYPVGKFNGSERVLLAECGYLLAATTENALLEPDADPYFVPRFSIGDSISFPEAICNMTGVWRPAIDPVIRFLRRPGRAPEALEAAAAQHQ